MLCAQELQYLNWMLCAYMLSAVIDTCTLQAIPLLQYAAIGGIDQLLPVFRSAVLCWQDTCAVLCCALVCMLVQPAELLKDLDNSCPTS
jgi:hypothetical protein